MGLTFVTQIFKRIVGVGHIPIVNEGHRQEETKGLSFRTVTSYGHSMIEKRGVCVSLIRLVN